MFRVFGPLHGLSFFLVSCTALAQPAPTPPDAPAATAAAPTGGTAPPLQACAVKAFDDYATAMSVWERQWADAVVNARPDFTTAVTARANAHNSALQRDGFRIHYLAANAPDSLELDQSIAALRLFDWTPQQEQALRLTQADYAGVADAAERDRLAADAQAKAEELENYFEESFTESAGATSAHKLNEVLEHGNAALTLCRKNHPAPPPRPEAPAVDAPPANATPEAKAPAAPKPP